MNLKSLPYKIPSYYDQSPDLDLELPRSKSFANRALILGAQIGNGFIVENFPQSTDVLTLIDIFRKIGIRFKITERTLVFLNSFPECEDETEGEEIFLRTGDGGTTNRFIIPLLCLGRKKYHLNPSHRMVDRPINDLIIALKNVGINIEHKSTQAWVSLQGPLNITLAEQGLSIDAQQSSQLASALLLNLKIRKCKLEIHNQNAEYAYLKMTEHIANQVENGVNVLNCPLDFSSLGYPLVLSILNGQLIANISGGIDKFQADSILINILKNCGANIYIENDFLIGKKSKLKSFHQDVSICPDLAMTLGFLASFIEGESVLYNVSVLRNKESDRLKELFNLFTLFKVNFKYDENVDQLIINGKASYQKVEPLNLALSHDHRVVMIASLFLSMHSGGEIAPPEAVEKSYPTFFQDLFNFY